MSESVVLFLDANALASPVTRTLVIAGARADGMRVLWSAHVEEEADRHARGAATRISKVRTDILGMELSGSATSTEGLTTTSVEDRQVMADAIAAGAKYLITTDVDDFAFADLAGQGMSAVNPDLYMASRFSEYAYREGIRVLVAVAKNPPRSEADVHSMLGRRHPHLTARFADLYVIRPTPADPDQPSVLFRGVACLRCGSHLDDEEGLHLGLCGLHRNADSGRS